MDLKANTAVDVLIGPFVDDTDGKTAETGLTLAQADIKLSKNGQALAQKSDATAASHDSDGYYNCELDATDTNTEGNLVLIVHESGALPVRHEFNVLAEAAWDSLYAAKDTGFMDVNVKAVSEDTTAADNLESACDNYSATRGLSGTALPDAAADAAGGLPISDAGGLDLDTQLAETDEITAARMGALTDWINGGRLDLILDIIAADTTTDIPALIATAQADLDTITGASGVVIADGALTAAKFGADCITAAKIADAAIDNATFAADVGSTAYATNIVALAVRKALDEIKLDHLVAIADDDDVVNDSIIGKIASTDGDWSNFSKTTDSLQSIRDKQTDIETDTAEIGAAGAGLTALPWNASWDAEVQSECTDALNAYDPPTKDELDTAVGAVTLANGAHGGAGASITLSDYSDFTGAAAANPNVLQSGTITVTTQTSFTLSAGSADDDAYNSMVIVFEDASTQTQKSVRTITDYVGASKTVTIDSAPDFTIASTDSFDILAVAPGSTPPTVGQIRTEMDDNSTKLASIETDTQDIQSRIPAALVSGRMSADTVAISGSTTAADNVEANIGNLDAPVSTVDTVVDGIQTDLDNATDGLGALKTLIDALPTAAEIQEELEEDGASVLDTIKDDLTDGGRLDLLIDAIKAKTDNLPADPASETNVDANETKIDTIDTVVDAIKAKTDNLPADPADDSDIDSQLSIISGKLDTIDNFLDTEIAAILEDTGTTLPATLSAIETDTQDIQSRLPAALVSGKMDADATAISGSTDAADKLEDSAETIVQGTAATGTLSTTEMTTSLTISVNDQYNGRILIFKSDTTTAALRGQATDITDTVTASGKLTFTALTTAPSNGDTFVIV